MKIRNRNFLADNKPIKPSNIEASLLTEAQFNTEAICENNWGQGQSNPKKHTPAPILNIQLLKHLAQTHRKTPGWCN